jgi:hypothetical protein
MITKAENQQYKQRAQQWQVAQDFVKGDPSKVKAYLDQGMYEQSRRYEKRKKLADFSPLTSSHIGKIVNIAMASSIDRQTPLPQSYFDAAGPQSQSYRTLMQQAAFNLVTYNATGIVVTADNIAVHTPLSIPRWTNRATVVKSFVPAPNQSVFEDERIIEAWTLYTPDGWAMYVQDDKDEVVIDQGEYGITYTDEFGEPVPPAQRFSFSGSDQPALGIQLANTHQSIYRMRSSIDSAAKEAINSSLIQFGAGSDKDFIELLSNKLKNDESFVPYKKDYGEHKPLSLPTGPIEEAAKVLREKEEKMSRIVGIYADRALENTATGARISSETGIVAIARELAARMESIENTVLRLASQAQGLPPSAVQVEYSETAIQEDASEDEDDA